MMQRKHYNAIAAALYSGNAPHGLISDIADGLAEQNNKFDHSKFIDKACNGPSMEQRTAKYKSHLRAIARWREGVLGGS